MLLNIPTLTRFPGGSADEYVTLTLPYLQSIDGEKMIMPGHGENFVKKNSVWNGQCFEKIHS